MHFVYLPGLDGTRCLREHLAAKATLVTYPNEVLGFDDYVEIAREHVREDSIVIGESFSGPVAVRIASEQRVRGIVLVTSFVKSPVPRWLAIREPRCTSLFAWWMVGSELEARRALRSSLESIDRAVLASRLRIVLEVDEREALRRTTAPLLDIRATRDCLRHSRRPIVRIRPDAATAEIDGPHGLLLVRAGETWKVIASWSATIRAARRPNAKAP